jgi:phosphomannomutase
LRRRRSPVLFDALHGSGAGVLDVALRRAGVRVEVLRGEPDPRFGGGAPDPVPARLTPLLRAVRRAGGSALGLATDGDADRFAVVDERGRPLAESAALALLVDHLARGGRIRRGVAISEATGSLVERVAAAHGLEVRRHPMGFRHLAQALAEGEADVAGEESGGFAWRPFCVDKDGVLAGCLFAEMTAQEPVGVRLAALCRAHGRLACARTAHALDPRRRAGLEALRRSPPARVDGARVLRAETRDGLRVALPDGFVMWRESGTEPVLRVYAEAEGARAVARRLDAARALLEAAGRRSR